MDERASTMCWRTFPLSVPSRISAMPTPLSHNLSKEKLFEDLKSGVDPIRTWICHDLLWNHRQQEFSTNVSIDRQVRPRAMFESTMISVQHIPKSRILPEDLSDWFLKTTNTGVESTVVAFLTFASAEWPIFSWDVVRVGPTLQQTIAGSKMTFLQRFIAWNKVVGEDNA